MNNQYDNLNSLRSAQTSHKRWIEYGVNLYEGKHLKSIQAPLSCTECIFGTWLYEEKKQLERFADIEKAHKEFHSLYETLYNNALIAHGKPKGIFSIGNSEQKNKRKFLLQDLNNLKEKSIELNHFLASSPELA